MAPSVTIVIPTYNRQAFLEAAVQSVIGQTFTDWELLIVDDGSADDGTEAVTAHTADARVRWARQEHLGRSAARNYGVELGRGEWLAFLDSDDLYRPESLAAHWATLTASPHLGLSLGGYDIIDATGAWRGQRRPWDESGLSLRDWLFNCLGVPGSVMVRRDWFERVQGFDTSLHMAEDWDLFLRLAQAGCPMGWTQTAVCQYRQHPGASVHNYALHRDDAQRALDKVFQQPSLAPEVAGLAGRAKAWVYAVYARRAFAAGQPEGAVQDLKRALALDPELAGDRRNWLLEMLFRMDAGGEAQAVDMEAAVTPYLSAALSVRTADIRAAQARAHMAGFFRAQRLGTQEDARRHLKAALQRDPRWLFNRGVLAYCLRLVTGSARALENPA